MVLAAAQCSCMYVGRRSLVQYNRSIESACAACDYPAVSYGCCAVLCDACKKVAWQLYCSCLQPEFATSFMYDVTVDLWRPSGTLVLALLRIAGGYCLSSTSPVCRWPGSNSWAATLLQNETVLAGQGQADSADIQALSFILRFHPSSSGYQDLPAIVSTSPSIAVQHQQHQLFVTATSTPYRFCNFQKAEQHQV